MFRADNAYVSQIEHQRRTMNYLSLRRAEDAVPVNRFPPRGSQRVYLCASILSLICPAYAAHF